MPGRSVSPGFASVARMLSVRVVSLTLGSIAVIFALKVLPGTASTAISDFLIDREFRSRLLRKPEIGVQRSRD